MWLVALATIYGSVKTEHFHYYINFYWRERQSTLRGHFCMQFSTSESVSRGLNLKQTAIYSSTYESQTHNAEGKDHATEEYIQYDSTYINLKANEIK